MHDYSDTTPDQLAMTAYTADPITGMPTAVTRYVPVIDDLGHITLVPEAHETPPTGAVTTHGHPSFAPAPAHAIMPGPQLAPTSVRGSWPRTQPRPSTSPLAAEP